MTKYSASGAVLMEEFAQPTEPKNPTAQTREFTPPPAAPVDPEDFEEEQEPEPIHDPEPEPQGIPVQNLLSPDTSATILVGTFDGLQRMILEAVHKWKLRKKLGSPKEQEKFHELCQQIEDGAQSLTELELPERAKVRLVQRVKAKIEALPFTDDEYNQLEEALVLIIKEMPQYQLPPSMALTLAAATIMTPRIMDAVLD